MPHLLFQCTCHAIYSTGYIMNDTFDTFNEPLDNIWRDWEREREREVASLIHHEHWLVGIYLSCFIFYLIHLLQLIQSNRFSSYQRKRPLQLFADGRLQESARRWIESKWEKEVNERARERRIRKEKNCAFYYNRKSGHQSGLNLFLWSAFCSLFLPSIQLTFAILSFLTHVLVSE